MISPGSVWRVWFWFWLEWHFSRRWKNGCTLCHILKTAVSSVSKKSVAHFSAHVSDTKSLFFAGPAAKGSSFYVMVPESDFGMPKELYSSGCESVPWTKPLFKKLISVVEQNPHFPAAAGGRDIESSGLSENCFNIARSWLDNCIATHTTCASWYKHRLPTRLLDVGSSISCVRLHVVNTKENVEYIALSHCWGSSAPLQTTTSNIEAMCHEIQLVFEAVLKFRRHRHGGSAIWSSLSTDWLTLNFTRLQRRLGCWVCSNEWYLFKFFLCSRSRRRVWMWKWIYCWIEEKGEYANYVKLGLKDWLINKSNTYVQRSIWYHVRYSKQRSKLSTRGWAF